VKITTGFHNKPYCYFKLNPFLARVPILKFMRLLRTTKSSFSETAVKTTKDCAPKWKEKVKKTRKQLFASLGGQTTLSIYLFFNGSLASPAERVNSNFSAGWGQQKYIDMANGHFPVIVPGTK